MTRIPIALRIIVGAGFVWAGCFASTPPKDEIYYLIAGPTAPRSGKGAKVAVADFSSAPGYDSQHVAYREGENELRYYGYRQWVSEPARILKDLAVRHLSASARFSEVAPNEKIRDADAVLEAHVLAFEEVDQTESERWFARLAMVFILRSERSEQILLRHAFDVTRQCAKRDPADVARVLGKIYAQQMDQVGQKVANALRKKTPSP